MTDTNIINNGDINTSDRIKKELIDTSYYGDVKYNLRSKSRWKFIGDLTESLSQICVGIATVLAFSAGFYELNLLSFLSGSFGTSSLVLLQFSSYAMKESKERTQQVNILLKKLGLDSIPDIIVESSIYAARRIEEV
ncbi:hypothetical protein QLL95_gp1244 [Cotonvirus japonicus]|uniref:SMODS and SLOG-associating 2TM effector domain-containing protein n=1 Tax=Cotonvirus japonicus TaxID=2811091 RepID=A0ABM7NRV5_9VIRU|nr:hypothetical protein QLL95_gp1244 [Cotonvirus japonicus]BCS82879.1 hypothetical protein [Cotonvirus japonicus]